MKLFTLFISNDTQNETEIFTTERAAMERWIECLVPEDDPDNHDPIDGTPIDISAHRPAYLDLYNAFGLDGDCTDGHGISLRDRLQDITETVDTYVLTEHELLDTSEEKLVTVHVSGGVVQDCECPAGVRVRVLDYDTEGTTDGTTETPDGPACEAIYTH